MKKNKKTVLIAAITTVSILSCIAVFNFCIDPFYHYHEPWFGKAPYLYNSMYQSPGVAKNFSYDSVLIGTSMTENFETQWFGETLGWDMIKLSYSGARTSDIDALLTEVFESKNEVDNIFIDINGYQYQVPADTSYQSRPEYLYDEFFWNDIKYLLNIDVLFASIGRIFSPVNGNMSTAYSWGTSNDFGVEQVLTAIAKEKQDNAWKPAEYTNYEDRLKDCDANLANITKHIEAHPDTAYYVYFPPYSVLYWEGLEEAGTLEDFLAIYGRIVETLGEYSNVQIFFCMDEMDIILDINNYRDACHHSKEINRQVADLFAKRINLVEVDEALERLNEIGEFTLNYEYE